MNDTQRGILSLIKSSITGEQISLPNHFSLEEAAELIRRQKLVPLIYNGAVNCGIDSAHPQMQTWFSQYYKALLQSERQQRAMKRLFQALDENAIDYMPVKGCNMKRMYPKSEMRLMVDADILIRMEQFEQLGPIMESLGYSLKVDTDHTCNWFCKDLYVELHKSLIPPDEPDYYSYYGTGWRLAVKGEGYRWDLSDEDAFVFSFSHFARHYRFSGIGCRHVTDLYVMRRSKPNMNWEYISQQLNALHLLEFYRNIMRLVDVWFEDALTDEKTEFISQYIFAGGSWGEKRNYYLSEELKKATQKGGIRNTKKRSLFGAIFPGLKQMRKLYPVLNRIPMLLPVFWCFRWIEVAIKRPQNIKNRIDRTSFVSDDAVSDFHRALNYVGLEYRFEE